jgi:hypothetical protein
MKNKPLLVTALFILLTVILGCSRFNPFSASTTRGNSNASADKSLTDQAVDAGIGEEKIGILECDEIVEFFVDQTKLQDEDFVTKAARGYALNKIRESFKKSLTEHKGDTAAMAKNCREFKQMLDKYKSEADKNANVSK